MDRGFLAVVVACAGGCSVFVGDDSASSDPLELTSTSTNPVSSQNFQWAHMTEAGDNRVLLVTLSFDLGSIEEEWEATSVSYDGVPLTRLRHDQRGILVGSELWRLDDPPVGTAAVNVTGSRSNFVIGAALGLRGVDQDVAIGSTALQVGGAGEPLDMVVSASAGDLVIVHFASDAGTSRADLDPAEPLWNLGIGTQDGTTSIGGVVREASGPVSLSGATAGQYVVVGFAVKPAVE